MILQAYELADTQAQTHRKKGFYCGPRKRDRTSQDAPDPQLKCQHHGFTLIELILVVTVIGIVASFAVPNFMRARMTAREGAALTTVRNLISSQSAYALTKGYGKFATDLNTLGTTGFIDSVLASGTQTGYLFSVSGTDATFLVTARPLEYGGTGVRSFYGDQSGVIRFTTADVPADSSSPPVGSQ